MEEHAGTTMDSVAYDKLSPNADHLDVMRDDDGPIGGSASLTPQPKRFPSVAYAPLSSKEIRLVSLLPGDYNDPICCELIPASLGDDFRYRALSYVWGSTRRLCRITVNGQEHYITGNLLSALQRLRELDQHVLLWVDALSINQQDFAERSKQVGLMRDIFGKAAEVTVYLGDVSTQTVLHKSYSDNRVVLSPLGQKQVKSPAQLAALLAIYSLPHLAREAGSATRSVNGTSSA